MENINYILIKSSIGLQKALASLASTSVIGVDIETTALEPRHGEIRLIQLSDGEDKNYIIDCFKLDNKEALKLLVPFFSNKNHRFVSHNSKFETKWFQEKFGVEFGRSFDTFLAAKLLDMDSDSKLNEVLAKYCGIEMSKEEQSSDWSADILSESQLAYAIKDAYHLPKLRSILIEQLDLFGMLETAAIEFEAVPAIAKMESVGLPLDRERHTTLVAEITRRKDLRKQELEDFLNEKLGVSITKVTQGGLFGEDKEIVSGGIEVGSPKQVLEAFHQIGIPLENTDKNYIIQMVGKYPELGYLSRFRTENILVNAFGEKFLKCIDPKTGRVHASYWQLGTATGRFSCISEGTTISCVNGEKPIEDVKVGDLVYCYSESGELRIRPVTRVFDNGNKECIKIKWISQGTHTKGELICTPDHKIKTRDSGWVEAQNLEHGQKVYHLHRNNFTKVNGKIRPRLFGSGNMDILEQDIIKRDYYKSPSNYHAHHIDEDTTNNSVENIKILSASEHTSYHTKKTLNIERLRYAGRMSHFKGRKYPSGESHSGYIHTTKFKLLRMLARAKGRPTYVSMDFSIFKLKCLNHGIDLKEVCKRYGVHGFISRGKLFSGKSSGIGSRRKKELLQFYGPTNHRVVSIETAGSYKVYDLEVEEFHNFIANEICVHNCSRPNLQQIPKSEEFRRCFRPTDPNRCFVISDFSAIELRILAHMSQDRVMLDVFNSGGDLHSMTAKAAFGLTCDVKDVKKLHPDKRDLAKALNFGIVYGMGAEKYALRTGISVAEAKRAIKGFYSAYEGAKTYLDAAGEAAIKQKYIRSLSGRKMNFHFDSSSEKEVAQTRRNGRNYPIQSTCGDILKITLTKLYEKLKKYQDAHIVNIIHDEIIIECDVKDAEEVKVLLEEAMIESGRKYLTTVTVEAEGKICDSWAGK